MMLPAAAIVNTTSLPTAIVNATYEYNRVSPQEAASAFFFPVLAYVGILALFMIVPFFYALRKGPGPSMIPELSRSLMTFGLILLIGIIVFQLLLAITTNVLPLAITTSVIEITKNVTTVLGGAISAIIGFYFGQRSRSGEKTEH
jgi:hypothetical protein